MNNRKYFKWLILKLIMKKLNIKNKWKAATLVLSVFSILLIAGNLVVEQISQNSGDYVFEEAGLKVSKENFNKITSNMEYGESQKVCSDINRCIRIIHID